MAKTIGVSMIVRNESEMICACLDSVKGVDEIVIVDTGSEDNTVELCKKYTDKVYTDYTWNDDFAEARNVSLSRCTTDFVLIIDADETLQCSVEGIRHILKFMTKDVAGHTIRFMGMMFDVQTGSERVQSIRIIRRVPEIKWESAVHNMLTLNGSNPLLKASCYVTKFEIKSGFSPSHFLDPDRSLRILSNKLKTEPDNARYMYYLAREYISRRMIPENNDQVPELIDNIIHWLEKYSEISFKGVWTNELSDAEYCLGLAYMEKYSLTRESSLWEKALYAIVRSILVLPSNQNSMDVLSALMMVLPSGNQYPGAAHFWQKIADGCDNSGVMQVRPRQRPDLKQMLKLSNKGADKV